MSYIPPNIIIPKEAEEQNKLLHNEKNINKNNSKSSLNEEEKASPIQNSINNSVNNKINSDSNKKKNKKLIKNKSEENIFKKEDLNKPITNYTKEEIIHYVHLIFLNNSSFFPKKQQYLMTTENFKKIIKNIGLIPNVIKLYELDILVKKVIPKTNLITYEDFMDILIRISQKIFPREYNKDKALVTNYFFHKIFLIYHDIIFETSVPLKDLLKYQYSSLVSLLNIIPDDSQIFVLNSLLYTLNEIYEKYFINNIEYNSNNGDNPNYKYYNNGNLNSLFNFCRDFEIFPFIFNETQIVTYYNLVVDNKELFKFLDDSSDNNIDSNCFTFNNFILFFVHLSAYNYTKVYESILDKEKNETELSKLIMLLTKLECSKGMRDLIDNSLPNLSLMPNRELFIKYNFDIDNGYTHSKEVDYNIINNEDNGIINGKETNNYEKINDKGKKPIRSISSINFYNSK